MPKALADLSKPLKGRKCGDILIGLFISYSGHGSPLCHVSSPEGIIVLDPKSRHDLRAARKTHPQLAKAFEIQL